MRRRWIAGAAATILAVTASVATTGWYTDAQLADGPAIPALVPPPPPFALSSAEPPRVDPESPEVLGPVQGIQSKGGVPAAAAVALERHGYSILVASFESRERAEHLVAELTAAGFAANAVEPNGGAAQRRFTLVRVGGYTSVADVESDLQRIRELPGSYRDARIEGLIPRH